MSHEKKKENGFGNYSHMTAIMKLSKKNGMEGERSP